MAAGPELSAAASARMIGANDRIRLSLIGCGGRGVGAHMKSVATFAKEQNVEFAAATELGGEHHGRRIVRIRTPHAPRRRTETDSPGLAGSRFPWIEECGTMHG